MLGIKLALGAEAIYNLVKNRARKRGDHLAAPLRIKTLKTGKIKTNILKIFTPPLSKTIPIKVKFVKI